MKNYKEKLKLQIAVDAICCIILAVFMVVAFDPSVGITVGSGIKSSGAACGVLVVMLFGLVRSIAAMKNEEKLKKLYREDTDERNHQIYLDSRASAMQSFLCLGLVAGIVAGYFNMTVGLTIISCVVGASLLCLLYKFYYRKKY